MDEPAGAPAAEPAGEPAPFGGSGHPEWNATNMAYVWQELLAATQHCEALVQKRAELFSQQPSAALFSSSG